MLDDFTCGVHRAQGQVHLGFANDGIDLAPADFHRLMEAVSNFDMDMVFFDLHGIAPRAGVVAYGMTMLWDGETCCIRLQFGATARWLTAPEWGQLMASLRLLRGLVAAVRDSAG